MNYDGLDVPLIDWSQSPEDSGKNFKGPQNPKQCKPKTTDFVEGVDPVKETKKREAKPVIPQVGFRAKDKVSLISVTSLINNVTLNGEYSFDSYDSYDNTCYIIDDKSGMTYNILLHDIKLMKNIINFYTIN